MNLSIGLWFTASLAWLYSFLWTLLAAIANYWQAGHPITQTVFVLFVDSVCVFPLTITLFALWIERVIRKNPALAGLLFGPAVSAGVNL